MLIATDHLTKAYSNGLLTKEPVHAVHDVSLEIHRGEIFAMLGLNGAGKTTFTRLLLDLVRPTAGTAFLFGTPVADGAWKSKTGYLPESFRVQKSWTPIRLLTYLAHLTGLRGAEMHRRIDTVLIDVGLSDARTRAAGTFSKGMLQRLGIAQAILHRPELLFLDEPTDGLDPVGRREIRELLVRLRTSGTGILLNSHLLSEVELVADRIGILHRGTLVVQGVLRELLPPEQQYIVEIPTDPAGITGWTFRRTEKGWTCCVSGADALDRALQQFRRDGISIASISPVRTSLEELFTKFIS